MTVTTPQSLDEETFEEGFEGDGLEAQSAGGIAPIECLTLPVLGLGHHDVLRAFDRLRRRLARRLRGTEGCFVGYHRLSLPANPLPPQGGRVTCIAVVVAATADRLDVRFEALLEPTDCPLGEPSSRAVRISHADGLVVGFA